MNTLSYEASRAAVLIVAGYALNEMRARPGFPACEESGFVAAWRHFLTSLDGVEGYTDLLERFTKTERYRELLAQLPEEL